MADNSYQLEIRRASKNGYFTKQEAINYYGRYSRKYYIVHWFGAPGQVGNHDQTVEYILRQAQAGNMSCQNVLSNEKITMIVAPDDVSFGAVSGNPDGRNVEHTPYLNDEGYKKSGWLKQQWEQRDGQRSQVVPHNRFMATQCPGTISLDRIEQECDKWRRGVYDQPNVPAPVPAPAPPAPKPVEQIVVQPITEVKKYTLANAKLVNIKDLSVVKTFTVDTPMDIAGFCVYGGHQFLLTKFAVEKKRTQGFLIGDLKDAVTPPPASPVEIPPTPIPEWVVNLRDIDDTEYWLSSDTKLVDITTGKQTDVVLQKDASFVASAVTRVGKTEYRITEYSYSKGIFKGVPIDKLTLTKPGVPDIKPVPQVTVEERLTALEKIVKIIAGLLGIKV